MLEILDAYTEPLRSFLAADFYATRKAMDLTQMEMADILDIDPRSYSSLEHGESLCSTRVFLRYILRFKKDRAQFMESIENVLKEADSHMSMEFDGAGED